MLSSNFIHIKEMQKSHLSKAQCLEISHSFQEKLNKIGFF